MITILIFAGAYCGIVVFLALFIVFMIQTKRWEIVAVRCGTVDCDLECQTCSLLPSLLKRQAD